MFFGVSDSKDYCCSVCYDVFKDPVLLSCSHSFCRLCLTTWWTEKPNECPLCKTVSQNNNPPSNLALKNLCESFLQDQDQRASEVVCNSHSKKLELFCLDHKQPVCIICRDSRNHVGHSFIPIDEAAQEHREKLQKSLDKTIECIKSHFKERGYAPFRHLHSKLSQLHITTYIFIIVLGSKCKTNKH
uniref:Tripartite motif-containing protein 35-like n=1 Tax=Oryzias sinensis TaxID=183150 RepID=A0A8C7Z2B5_9TELE